MSSTEEDPIVTVVLAVDEGVADEQGLVREPWRIKKSKLVEQSGFFRAIFEHGAQVRRVILWRGHH